MLVITILGGIAYVSSTSEEPEEYILVEMDNKTVSKEVADEMTQKELDTVIEEAKRDNYEIGEGI